MCSWLMENLVLTTVKANMPDALLVGDIKTQETNLYPSIALPAIISQINISYILK